MTHNATASFARRENHSPLRSHPTLPVALIVLIGFAMRLAGIGLMRYGYDHSYPAYQALGLLDAGIWPLIGQPSSVFLDNPALMSYLQLIPLLIDRSPWMVAVFMVLFNSLAIWFVYAAAHEMLDYRAGLVAAFLFAVNPWLIWFSQASWVQALVPLFVAVTAWGLWGAWAGSEETPTRRSAGRYLIGGLALVALTQTYVQGWGLLPSVAVLTVLYWRHVSRRAFVATLMLGLAGFTIYLAGMSASGFATQGDKLATLLAAVHPTLQPEALLHAVRLVNGLEFTSANSAGIPTNPIWPGMEAVVAMALGAALAVGIFLAVRAVRSGGRSRRVGVVLLVWFGLPILLATLVSGAVTVHPHYLLLTVPAGTILAAWTLDSFYTCRLYALVTTAFLGAVMLSSAVSLSAAHAAVAAAPIWPAYDGWSLNAATALARTAAPVLEAEGEAAPQRMVASGNKALLSGLTGHLVDPIDGASFPDYVVVPREGRIFYLMEGEPDVPRHLRPFFDFAAAETAEVADGVSFALLPTTADAATSLADQPFNLVEWPSDAGLTLLGYRLQGEQEVGGVVELIVLWRVDDLHPDRGQWFVGPNYHLVDGDNQILSNVGQHGGWADEWALGDLYVERIDVPIPLEATPGWHVLDAGLYDSVRNQPYSFINGDQRPQRYSIPLFLAD